MIKIDPRHLKNIAEAEVPNDLWPLVQGAIRLEFSTIPPYLTAMMSLHVDQNRLIWSVLHSVVIEEMLHMSIMCNLLNALGGVPSIDRNDFVVQYPSPLPLSIGTDLIVGLEPFSIDLVQNTFMAIEQPEKPLVFVEALAEPTYKTIGDFYRALKEKVLALGDRALTERHQFTAPQWYDSARLFPLKDAASAARAIDLIVEEGEGTQTSPLADGGVVAHYYRFQEISKGHYLIPDGKGSFAFKGDPIPFDPSGVFPITKNQRLKDIEAGSQGLLRASQFAYSFSKLLTALDKTFNGAPEQFDAALALMFELKLNGQKLCGEPVLINGKPGPQTYGPCFERVWQD